MNNSNSSKSNLQNTFSWVGIALITLAAFVCTYYYSFSGPIRSIIWLSWFVISLLLGYLTVKGKQAFEFGLESKAELMKVVWPTRHETTQTTIIVMVMVALTGFILWLVDSVMIWAIAKITQLG